MQGTRRGPRAIGTEIGAKAAPDGYTLTIGSTSTLSSNVSLLPSLPFDPVRDFAPRKQVLVRGMEPGELTPEELGRHIRADIERWRKVTREAGILAQ